MNIFDDDPGLRHTVEFYLGPEQMELIGDELSEFGAIAAGELSDCVKRGDPRAAKLIHQSGLMALHSEPGNAVEHIALCFMIARTPNCHHLPNISLESGLAKLLSVVDVEELRFEFMAGLLDRRVEARPRVGKTDFDFEFPLDPRLILPKFTPGATPESPGKLRGEKMPVTRSDANLILALAQTDEGETVLCLAQAESHPLGLEAYAEFDEVTAWRIGTSKHALEFMLDFLRANEQVYELVLTAGMLRTHDQTDECLAWSAALLAGAVYLVYIEDMVELGHARQPEAVFRRVMLECVIPQCANVYLRYVLSPDLESDSAKRELRFGYDSADLTRLANEMNEKNLWPLCREKFEKFLDELDEPRMEPHRETLREKILQLMNTVEANPSESNAPALAGGLFMALALASEANWSLKNRDYVGKMESVARVIETLNQ